MNISNIFNYSHICFFLQLSTILSGYFLSPSPQKFSPEVSKYFGRFVFLTYQANHYLTYYYLTSLINEYYPLLILKEIIIYLYPLAFSLGCFVTSAYYLLDHTNPEQIYKRKILSHTHPYIYLASHIEHALPLPIIFTYNKLSNLTLDKSNNVVLLYSMFYISFLHINKQLTNFWVYPIIQDIETNKGIFSRNLFFIFLFFVFYIFGHISTLI